MESLSFTRQEMAAIIKLGTVMAAADRHLHENETTMMATEALRFNLSEKDFGQMLTSSDKMEAKEALFTIATMTDSQKRYVTAYLGTLMSIDGNIDDKEMALWSMVSSLCKLPTMSIADAIEYMTE